MHFTGWEPACRFFAGISMLGCGKLTATDTCIKGCRQCAVMLQVCILVLQAVCGDVAGESPDVAGSVR